MGIKSFLEGVQRERKPKKNPLSESFLCCFTERQMEFITEEATVYGKKSVVIRRGIQLLMDLKEKEKERLKNL